MLYHDGLALNASKLSGNERRRASVQVITISGRTIRKEAQASPELAEAAILRIDNLVNRLPDTLVSQGQLVRQQRGQ